jgi:molybdenum cofactor cytidylyltransferase
MGDQNKLLLEVGGRPVLTRVLAAFANAPVAEVVVVTGADHDRVAALVEEEESARPVHNPDFELGMASSIRRGVQAATEHAAGVVVCPGDLPFLSSDVVQSLCDVFVAQDPSRVVRPIYEERPGHPVIFDASFRGALVSIRGDQGARGVVRRNEDALTRVPVEDDGVCVDVDTPEALRRARRRLRNDE